jgi:hypothetical protein
MMQIDDFRRAKELTQKLKQSTPFMVRPGKQLLKTMREKGEVVSPEQEFEVAWVEYSGDEGGIMCALGKHETAKQVYVSSLTHLEFDPTHPLAEAVKSYQNQRLQGLNLQNRKSVMAELMRMERTTKQKRSGKGGFSK